MSSHGVRVKRAKPVVSLRDTLAALRMTASINARRTRHPSPLLPRDDSKFRGPAPGASAWPVNLDDIPADPVRVEPVLTAEEKRYGMAIKGAKKQFDRCLHDIKKREHQIDVLTSQLVKLQHHHKTLQNDHKTLQRKYRTLDHYHTQLRTTCEKLNEVHKNSRQEFDTRYNELRTAHAKLKSACDKMRAQYDELRQAYNHLKSRPSRSSK